MTQDKAIKLAKRVAAISGDLRYIVWSNEPVDAPGEHYHVCSEFDLDTFFSGCEVVFCVSSDGIEN
jgi:hypothetical protein